jgi:hypothetical protein
MREIRFSVSLFCFFCFVDCVARQEEEEEEEEDENLLLLLRIVMFWLLLFQNLQ